MLADIATGLLSALLFALFSFGFALAGFALLDPYFQDLTLTQQRWPSILIALIGAYFGYKHNQRYHKKKREKRPS